jgi:MFS family permease
VSKAASSSKISKHQWIVLIVAYLGWVFDLMDVFLMVLVRDRAMTELLGPGASPQDIGVWGGWALGITLIGWAAGGLIFGIVADRWGRARTMALTILIYAVFTGACGFAQTPMQLILLRFIASLGIGGEWGAGASMIAEVFPKASRAVAAGVLQSAAATGFFAAILLEYLVGGNWRYAFFGGAVPAVLALVVRLSLREPETWVAVKGRAAGLGARVGSLAVLFGDPELRRRVLLGTALAVVGIFAYWGTNFWVNARFTELLRATGADPTAIAPGVRRALIVLNLGNLAGFLLYIPLTNRVGRKVAFAVFHVGALVAMPLAYLGSTTYELGLFLFFFAGLFTSGIYSGYTIYFPELFPTHVRATGASFCYNVGRVVSAPGPVIMGWLTGALVTMVPAGQQVAYAGAIMGCVYALGLLVIPFLPETRGVDIQAEG